MKLDCVENVLLLISTMKPFSSIANLSVPAKPKHAQTGCAIVNQMKMETFQMSAFVTHVIVTCATSAR